MEGRGVYLIGVILGQVASCCKEGDIIFGPQKFQEMSISSENIRVSRRTVFMELVI
jgi:hypothetical protein